MNDVSLKEFLNSRIDDVKDSVKTAYQSMEKRLEGMNEFRDQLKDQAAKFVTREELDAKLESLNKTKKDNTTLIIAIIGIIMGLTNIILKFL